MTVWLQDLIEQKKSAMPLRLICTEDGKLYDRNAIEARFRAEHALFFEPAAVSPDVDTIRAAVDKAFAYAMLSHRWEMVEPLYKDLDGTDVFSLAESPGTRKLQQFYRHARERGFRWAWSDTCCIDKSSTSELQKSIISMFKWYRNSDLTIVYLGDVSDNSIEVVEEEYLSDWTFLVTSDDLPIDNYKESPTFCKLISEITGIDDAALTHFDPASRQPTIRQRMSWAARRKTTEIEDIAYCLMGVFDVHFPVMYGEGDGAFIRLQIEIMAKSDDPSLFDWTGKPGTNSFIAASPACFDPFAPPIVDPVPATMMARQDAAQGTVQRVGVNAQHPANYMAGAKIHCHGLEYAVWDVEETKAMTDAREAGYKNKVFQYHIITESLHPITVTLEEPIKTGVWDESLATGWSTEKDGNHPLRQPFVAHLLLSRPGGIYRRIQDDLAASYADD
ncbi:heterokaryon incompatibility protein-domain-containing protein [Chiua virens]|nr:heterokaryon incompatibility protein-domain-containing protein [Chiua virens]